jgi:hypothetical protein
MAMRLSEIRNQKRKCFPQVAMSKVPGAFGDQAAWPVEFLDSS